MLQKPAYRRTTATHLAKLDYRFFAAGLGVGYVEALQPSELDSAVKTAFATNGPVLVRIATDYNTRKIRWIEAVRERFAKELSAAQKTRFLARIAVRETDFKREAND
jgi:acetolactate synthase-1/2/3 large subunit